MEEAKGWVMDLLTDDDVDWNRTAIRNELIARYEDADPKFDYIVIVGDDSGPYSVPASSGTGYGHGDHQYATLAGGDQLVDVGLGRISVESNSQVETYVNKVLTYEKNVDLDNTDWYLRGALNVSSNHSGYGTVLLERYHRHAMLDIGYTQADTAWVSPWGQGNTNNRSVNRINAGVSFYSARGYGGTGLNIGTINGLSNDDMTPVVIDLTCWTGNWSQELGINESYMRAGTPTVARGGIGAIGNATGGTNPRFNNCLGIGAGNSVLVLRNPTLGDMHFGAKLNIWNNFNGLDGNLANFNQWDNLMGDPLVWLWTSIPQIMDVETIDSFDLGTNSVSVIVTDGGTPIENAWVTFYKVDDDEEIIERGITDSQGAVTLNTPVRFTGTAYLTITKQHYAPYQLELEIGEPAARVSFTSIDFIDDGTNGTVGNNNGIPEAGETVGLAVTARNFGEDTQSAVTLSVASDDPWINQVTGESDFGDMESGDEGEGDGLILVEILPEYQNEWISDLTFTFTSGEGEYEDHYGLQVKAPQYAFVQLNGVNGFDPGETTTITVRLMNVGGSAAAAADLTLESLDPTLGITDETASLGSLTIGQSRTSTSFGISSHPTTFPGTSARAMITILTDDGQVDTTWFSIPIGSRSSDDPVGPDHYGYYAFDNIDTDYELAPTYDWVEIASAAPEMISMVMS